MTVKKTIQKIETKPKKSRTQRPVEQSTEKKQSVCLLGDDRLVKEYSGILQEHGIAVMELKNLATLSTSSKKISIAFELTIDNTEAKQKNLIALDAALPADIPIVTNSVAATVLSQSQSIIHKDRMIGIAAFPTLLDNKLVELSPSLYTSQSIADTVSAFFALLKKERAVVEDAVGMVMPRILCQIINEALFTVQNDVANPKDIDSAMKYGTNYPLGPIEWGEKIGFKYIVLVLDALYEHQHDARYRIAPLLRQLALAGTFWREEK